MPGVLPFSSQAPRAKNTPSSTLPLNGSHSHSAGVADADRINVAVVEQLGRPAADFADDVAHLVEPHFVKAELAHFGFGALARPRGSGCRSWEWRTGLSGTG